MSSVIGTVFFVFVFMLALGSMAYASGLQTQVSQAELQAESVAASRGAEALAFSSGAGGVLADNGGPSALAVGYVVLLFSNGTAYTLPVTSDIPAGGSTPVR